MIKSYDQFDALSEMVDSALETCPYFLRKEMDFETAEGRVVLRGEVQSYYQKQMAQEAVRRVDGVERIDNHLTVNWT